MGASHLRSQTLNTCSMGSSTRSSPRMGPTTMRPGRCVEDLTSAGDAGGGGGGGGGGVVVGGGGGAAGGGDAGVLVASACAAGAGDLHTSSCYSRHPLTPAPWTQPCLLRRARLPLPFTASNTAFCRGTAVVITAFHHLCGCCRFLPTHSRSWVFSGHTSRRPRPPLPGELPEMRAAALRRR